VLSKRPISHISSPEGFRYQILRLYPLTVEELEALRLVDVEGLRQEDSAIRVGISRRAFWEDLKASRMKIAFVLTTGKAIEIKGGNYISAEGGDISEDADT
jgi:uncharacterized protein